VLEQWQQYSTIPAYELEKNHAGYHADSCDNYRDGGDHEDAEIRRKVAQTAMAAVRRRHRSWFGEREAHWQRGLLRKARRRGYDIALRYN
jgi:hypothetical protein